MTRSHQTFLEITHPVAAEVTVGAEIVFEVKVSCDSGCDLRTSSIHIKSSQGVMESHHLVTFDEVGRFNKTDEFIINAPGTTGVCTWEILFPACEVDNVIHENTSLKVSFATQPHETSLAVWDIPTPVLIGETFAIKVGAKSSVANNLKDARIEIHDEAGALMAFGTLGGTPWQETSALYWTELEIVAPPKAGMLCWTAQCTPTGVDVPHSPTRCSFSFVVVRPAEHRVMITLIDKLNKTPIENGHVRLGAYQSTTDECGITEIAAAAGIYQVTSWKPGYLPTSKNIETTKDFVIQLELDPLPEEDFGSQWL